METTIMTNNLLRSILKTFFNWWYKKHPPEMVGYWRRSDSARAKITRDADGSLKMQIEGEKYLYPGYPRGYVLVSSLARLKKKVKQSFFNDIWNQLEAGIPEQQIMLELKGKKLQDILRLIDNSKLDMIPVEKMVPAVKEIWRAFEAITKRADPIDRPAMDLIKRGICFFFQEDDAYRFRAQWLAPYLNPKKWWKKLLGKNTMKAQVELAFNLLKHAEVVIDMKLRIDLIFRVLMTVINDNPGLGKMVEDLAQEINWKKLYLSKADKYYFRGKHFKVEHDHYDY